MENIRLNVENALPFLSEAARESYLNSVKALSESLEKGTCAGKDYLGWLHLPSSLPGSLIDDIKQTAAVLRNDCDVVVVAGIGGSYLGARAVIEALNNSFAGLSGELKPALVFAGHNIRLTFLDLSNRSFPIPNLVFSPSTIIRVLSAKKVLNLSYTNSDIQRVTEAS